MGYQDEEKIPSLSSTSPTKIKIQTFGPRGRSGSAKNYGSGWSQIRSPTSWSNSPRRTSKS